MSERHFTPTLSPRTTADDPAELHLRDEEIAALGEVGYFVRDRFEPGLALLARAEAERLTDRMRPAGIGRGADHQADRRVRGDEIMWLEPEAEWPALSAMWRNLDRLRLELNAAAHLGLQRMEVQLARYAGDGRHYDRHLDAFPGPGNRRVTALVYLNPVWRPEHGGQLRLFLPEGARDVEPIAGRLVVFLSDRVEHGVLPAHADRYAMTAWYRGPSIL